MRLLEPGEKMLRIVARGFETKGQGMTITSHAAHASLFHNLSDGDLYHLGRISVLKQYPAGTMLVQQGSAAKNIYLIISGEVAVQKEGKTISIQDDGCLIGEMSLVDDAPRSADLVVNKESSIIKIDIQQLKRLMDTRPRLGCSVALNLAKSLSTKLRSTF